MRPVVVAVLFLFVITIQDPVYNIYCPSNCYDFIGTCFSQEYSDTQCIVCAGSIYNQYPDPDTNLCILNNQTEILAVDLQSPISLTGFTGSDLSPYTCGTWSLSGKYVEGSYLSKVYNTPTPHYLIVVRYNLMYIGSGWSTTDTMTVAVDENVTSFPYRCSYSSVICSTQDCPKIGQVKASHNASNATVVLSSSILNTSGASWGVSNLMIVLLTCNSSCSSCFGPSGNQCFSCSNNTYLLGNTCVKQCPIMSVPSTNLCVPACPGGFYSIASSKICSPCSKGCSVCTGPLVSNCILDTIEPTVWQQQEQFWIFLIVFIGIIAVIALVFLVIKRRKDKLGDLKEAIIHDNKTPTEVDMAHMATNKSEIIQDEVYNQQSNSSSNSNSSDDGPKAVKVKRKWKGKQ